MTNKPDNAVEIARAILGRAFTAEQAEAVEMAVTTLLARQAVPDLWLGTDDVARLFGRDRRWVWEKARKYIPPPVQLPGTGENFWYYPELFAWLATQTHREWMREFQSAQVRHNRYYKGRAERREGDDLNVLPPQAETD